MWRDIILIVVPSSIAATIGFIMGAVMHSASDADDAMLCEHGIPFELCPNCRH
jgi:hypothetical protein